MRFLTSLPPTLMLVAAISSAQGAKDVGGQGAAQRREITQTVDAETKTRPTAPTSPGPQDKPSITVYLVGGGRMQVDEVRKSADGFWYRRGNVTTLLDKTRVARIELSEDTQPALASRFVGDWSINDSARVEKFFKAKFDRSLPLTAFGQSELHTRWGLDHRQGIDVGLHPDSPEGRALITFLRTEKIPFLAFRGPVPGVATGPHIHIGKGSHRLPAP